MTGRLDGSRLLFCRRLLERQQLFGPECLVVDLGGCFNQVLQMCPDGQTRFPVIHGWTISLPGEEVSEIDEFAVVFVFHVDDSPSALSPSNRFAVDNNASLRPDNSEWEHILHH